MIFIKMTSCVSNILTTDVRQELNVKFFDLVVCNPPYNDGKNQGSGHTLWNKFIPKCLDLLDTGGMLLTIHPSGWRNVSGNYKSLQNVILSNYVKYLEIHNESDGKKVFGCHTRYDWYLLEKGSKGKTHIKFDDNSEKDIELIVSPNTFIPNSHYDEIQNLLSKDALPLNVLYSRSSYGTENSHMGNLKILNNNLYHIQGKHISKSKTSEFHLPCIYLISKSCKISLRYSSKNVGHFGIPKLIWTNGRTTSVGSIIDEKGEYGLTEFAYGIIDDPSKLSMIKRGFDNPKFRKVLSGCSMGQQTINYRILQLFRKDFYRDYI